MERPNKEDFDFNEHFETVRFARDMIRYADYLENTKTYTEADVDKAYDKGIRDGRKQGKY